MVVGLLAGAGLVALLDLTLRLPLQAAGFWREAALLACAGALAAASVAGAVLLLRRLRGARVPVEAGAAFWTALGLAAVPPLGSLLPKPTLAVVVGLVLVPLAGRLARAWAPPPALGRLLAAVPFAGLLLCLLLPGTPPPRLGAGPDGPAPAGPDVLLISCDTLRADSLDELAGSLPHLEALRDRGRWAPYGLAPSSSTRPSHTTMLSGLPVVKHAVRNNQWRMGDGIGLVSERFQEAGWRTAAVVSNAMISGVAGFSRGFEVFDETPIVRRHFRNEELSESGFSLARLRLAGKSGSWVGWLGLYGPRLEDWLLHEWKGLARNTGNGEVSLARAEALLAQLLDQERPYFLFVHLMDPHTPYGAPAAHTGRPGRAEGVPEAFRRDAEEEAGDWKVVERVGAALAAGEDRASAAAFLEQLRQLYLEEVVYVDEVLGRLLARIEAGGRETVVLFTSDHGEHFGEHDLVMHSNSLYEPLVRVPFLLAGPGVEPGRFEHPPQLEDVVPTLLGLAGLPTEGYPGRVLGRAGLDDRPHVERFHEWLAVRRGPWKLILKEDEDGGLERVGLFHLDEDPGELADLSAAQPEVLAELGRLAEAARAAERAAGGAVRDEDAAHHEALAELGYVGY
jgi:arylsulfatase A-like enzyme